MTSANPASDELTLLRELVSTLQTTISTLNATLEETRKENSLLRQKIDALCRRVFGSSSEKIDPAQLELLLQRASQETLAPDQPPAIVEKKRESVRAHKERAPRLPDNLPTVDQIIEPDEVIAQPDVWRFIGQEISEQLD